MGIARVSDNVYSVGVIDPSLRVFDVVMETKFGTSYNAYLASNGGTTVLIDSVHEDFFDEYFFNVSCLTDISEIKYVIMNHTELDHSGSLKRLLELNPKITVVCSAAAQKYLKQMLNREFDCKVVKHNDVLEVGSFTFRFLSTPLLHWPDSMMTYFEADNVLFTCDFLGCHFCEPTMLEENVHYKEQYLIEFQNYYNGIFGPFKKHVLTAIDKIKDLNLEYICPSHGPILSESIKERISDYFNFSQVKNFDKKKIVIVYASAYGCTKEIAYTIFEELKLNGSCSVEIYDVVKDDLNLIKQCMDESDVLILGSCTINKSIPKAMWDVISSIDAINSRGKVCGVFGSYGWSGEAIGIIASILKNLGLKLNDDPIKFNFRMSNEDRDVAREYARTFVL